MKLILILLFSLLCKLSYALTYYVSAFGSTGSGLNESSSWSFSKLKATTLASGDIVLFKRGDVFYGTLIIGTSNITYGAYGTGDNPVITGFTQLTSWTPFRGNIYYAVLDVPTLNMVTIDGVVKGMGRYPNTGYLTYTSHSGNASITGATIGSIPFDPTGGEVVIRKVRWILDRHPITSRSGNTLNYSTNNNYGNDALYSPYDGNGYFIQGNLSTLDQEGEWYYDHANKKLYMYFNSSPAERTVKAASVIQNLYINYWTNLTFNNIDFEGGNVYGAYVIGTSNIAFNNCNFRQQGGDGLWSSYTTNLNISGGTVNDAMNNGLQVEQGGNYTTINGVTVTNSGEIAGAARSGDGNQEGITIGGDNTIIQNCSVINSGYVGINFAGNNVLVQKNFINTFSNVKDDGAGIYTYTGSSGGTNSNRVVSYNIILNAIGAFAGAEGYYWENFGKAAGIYLDDYANHTEVSNNTISTGNWLGIFLHNASSNQIINNLVYNFATQIDISKDLPIQIRSNTITGNTFISKTATQKVMEVETHINDNVSLFGTFNNNIYARPIDDNLTITVNNDFSGGNGLSNISLDSWKSYYNQEANSQKSLVFVSDINKFRFDYNFSSISSYVPLIGCWSDVRNINSQTMSIIAPFSGKVLISTSYLNKPLIVSAQ